jgi:ABC-type Fe3+-hydroxamate transport system substrate-binding protein
MGPPFGGPGQTLNRDAVLKAAPDVIISMALSKIDDIEVRAAEKLQEELNIPVLIYDGALDRSGEVLRRVGALVGAETRGEALADYFEARFAKIQRNLAGIPRAERRTVYYAQSPTGMLTDPAGARHSEIIDFAGGVNIAETYEQRGCGRTKISADDLMRWDPDVIIMMSDEGRSADRLYTRMKADPFWSALTAVRKGRYHEPPAGMYHWLDRPPSVNRVIGLIWLANLLYPYHFDWDMVAETRTFYQLFYRLNLSRKQAETILGMHN